MVQGIPLAGWVGGCKGCWMWSASLTGDFICEDLRVNPSTVSGGR